jgi:hypothetical protein
MESISINDKETLILNKSDIMSMYQDLSILELDISHFKHSELFNKSHTAFNVIFISDDGEIKILKNRQKVYLK